jgi:hypothetical protein
MHCRLSDFTALNISQRRQCRNSYRVVAIQVAVSPPHAKTRRRRHASGRQYCKLDGLPAERLMIVPAARVRVAPLTPPAARPPP